MMPLLSFLILMLSQLMVAISIVCNKILLLHMPLKLMLGFRFLIASLLGLPIILINFKSLKNLKRNDWAKLLGQAILGGCLFNLFMYGGLSYTSASYAGLMYSVLPLMILIFSFLLLKEALNIYQVLAILIASFGVVLIHYQPLDKLQFPSQHWGSLLIFLALLTDTIYFIFSKRYPLPIPNLLSSVMIILMNSLIFIPSIIGKQFFILSLEPKILMILFLMSLSIILFYLFWLKASQHVSGFAIALATACCPVMTLAFSSYILDESLSKTSIVGMLLIMLALILQFGSVSKFSKWPLLNKINRNSDDIEDTIH
jgi:drug/metabolite transporter (DMT)-like permease